MIKTIAAKRKPMKPFRREEGMRTAQLEALRQASLSLTASLDLGEVLNAILESALGMTRGGSIGHIFLYFPEDGGRLEFGAAMFAGGRNGQPFAQPRREGLTISVARSGEPLLVADMRAHPIYRNAPPSWTGSIIGLPLKIGQRVVGVMNIAHQETNAFSQDDLTLLRLLGDQAAIAIENARLYEQVATERRQIAHLVGRLENEQHKLEWLVEWLPVGILVLDKDFNLVLANSIGNQILESIGSGGLGEPLSKWGPLSIQDLVTCYEEPVPVEVSLPGHPHRTLEIQVRSLVLDGPQWLILLSDVTQERQNQARIQMQERLATVGQLAAGIAHDFNNIMSAILVYTDLLLKDPDLNPPARDRLAIIQQQVQRASSLIRQILDFSRKSAIEQSLLDLLPFVKELDKLLVRVLPETIRLDLIYQPEMYLVNADPTRLQQVFMNLAVNARDSMPKGGVLCFELGRLHLEPGDTPPASYIPAGDWILIAISDTGNGIPAEVLPHIFEPFYTTKPVGQGTGLGLAQAYGIVKQHEGYIDVHSRVGEGTRFEIYLPALPVPQLPSPEPVESPEKNGQGEVILVVEDDAVTREALQALLEAQNYRVLTAANGIEALMLYDQQGDVVDLVISDVVMPQMGGYALYQELRERYPQTKMLFVTGHPLQEENTTMLAESGISWLQKPFSVPDFSQVVQILLSEGEKQLSRAVSRAHPAGPAGCRRSGGG